jgi:hypothetical protein
MRAGEVIAKLAEDAYFMRVDNRVAQVPPPSGIAKPTTKPQVAVQLTTVAIVLEESYRLTPTSLGHGPMDLLRVATAPAVPVVTATSSVTVILAAVGSPHTELEGEPVAEAIAAAEATQTATSPVSRAAATMPVAESRKFGATNS